MTNIMHGAVSERPARFFEEISAIPRASRAEGQIADYLEHFAATRNLRCYRDAAHNVLICKEGTVGRESEPPLLLQAHTDMVTEIAFGIQHDFSRQGVSLRREGNILSANGTTLGADDGFGVAYLLSVLDGAADSHPPLECLFTAAEEIGLVGAGQFDYSRIAARRMLNFDSAEEHVVITGCCGGIRSDLTLPVTTEAVCGNGIRIMLHGLCGGHSGEDIHRGRANALSVVGAVLTELEKRTPFRVVSLIGGDKTNAIPRDCEAVILPENMEAARAFLTDAEMLLATLVTSPDDRGRTLSAEETTVHAALALADTKRILAVLSVRNGVFYWRKDGKTPPETSRNLASVRTEKEKVTFCFSSRSPLEERIDECSGELDALAASLGGSTGHRARYPGWESASDSPVCTLWQEAYRSTTQKDIHTTVIHAGLECGLISARLPGLDVISIGCNIFDLHTPAERMELDSFERVYRTLLSFLRIC